jgi:hypothetical protein
MKHEDWQQLVSAYCDGEVTPEERARVEAHLAECAECAEALAAYRRLGQAIRALPQGTPSRTLWFRIQEGLARPARPLWWRLLPVASAAVVLLVAVVAGFLLRPPSGPAPLQAPEDRRSWMPTVAMRSPMPTAPALKSYPGMAPSPPSCPGIPLALEMVAISARDGADLASPRLVGVLYDGSGRPLPDVTLVISGTAGWQGTATTASDGTFSLSLPTAGTYQVVLALSPAAEAAAAPQEEMGRPYSLTLPDGTACQAGTTLLLPALAIGPRQEISLTLRAR